MRTVSYRLGDLARATINIGKVAENEYTRVQFNAEQIFAEYPAATAALSVINPAGTAYPAVVTREGDLIIWDVTDADLTAEGMGELQLTLTENGVVIKSYIARTRIERSIVASGSTPDPVQNWLDNAAEVLEEVQDAIPAGGTQGQVMGKLSDDDYDIGWINQTGGGGGGGTSNYNDLSNKPQIAGTTLSGNKTLEQLGIASADAVSAKYTKPASGIPASDLASGVIPDVSGFYTKPQSGIPASDLADGVIPDVSGLYTKPSGGIPKSDLASGVQSSLGKADTAYQKPAGGIPAADIASGVIPDPTNIIDDTAGDGDTDKVWSADKTAGEVSTLSSAIATKAETKTTTESGVDLDISDENGNVLVELKNGHIKTKYFDSSASGNSGIIARNSDVTDGVYASCRYHQPSASSKQFCILMGADFHSDATRLTSMVEYLNAVDAFDAGICLGDIGSWEKDATFYTTAISNTQKPFLTVIGNHDAAEGNTLSKAYTNISDLVAKFITPNIQYADLASGEYTSGKSYYYKDFATYGIRLIVLNNYEYPTDNDGTNFMYHHGWECWSQDQVDWFISTLNSTPTTYGVIVAAHFVPTSMAMDKTGIWTSATMQYNSWSPDTTLVTADRSMLAEIVDAWIDGSTLSKTYSFDVSGGTWSGITVSADFTSRGAGEFIAWIGGHLHMSLLGTIYGYTDQHVYLADCSGVGSSLQGDTPRKVGTRSEDALCVLSVDRTNKTVKLLRVGAHFTMDGVDRLYGKFSYAGS